MKITLVALLYLTAFSQASAFSSPCAKSGWTGLRANDGSGFIIYIYREAPDLYFLLTGKQVSFPDGQKSTPKFFIDGVLYQSLLVNPSKFTTMGKRGSDLEILKQHQKYEWDYMQTTGTPLKKLEELGPRDKAAHNGQPAFTFYLWRAADPSDAHGTRQYFLTTVSEGMVVVLSAIVRDDAHENLAFQAFESYVRSFQHILNKKDCPEKI
jgi:hypothetical protein